MLEPRFEERVDHHNTSPRHTGLVEVFHKDRLIVGRVGTPDDQKVGRDHIGQRTRCCRDANGGLERSSRWRMADASCRVDIRDTHCTRCFTGDVIGLVGDAATRKEHANSIGVGLAQPIGNSLEGFIPRDARESPLTPSSSHGMSKTTKRSQFLP